MTDATVRLLFVAAKLAAVFVAQASVISPPPFAVSVPPVTVITLFAVEAPVR